MSEANAEPRARWLAFILLCCGDVMIVLDSTVVNVALPTIQSSLNFSEAGLVWVINAYLLTYGGFMLLGGRLADYYGQRRLFIIGTIAFTLASLLCGLATSGPLLVIARALQGFGGAVVSAVALSLITNLFPEGPERVRAMGYFGFIASCGGSIGVLLGGLMTDALGWRSVFLINIPVGVVVVLFSRRWLPAGRSEAGPRRLDIAGAVTVTTSLLCAVYAIVDGEHAGWTSPQTIGLLATSVLLMALFLFIEARISAPLVPLSLFKIRNVAVANIIAVLWAAGMFAWFFLAALYMQRVLGYGPMQVGLAFLPANIIMGAFSYKLAAMTVNRFGIRLPLTLGLMLAALGLFLFALIPSSGVSFAWHIMPGMLLLGVGVGMAFNPVLLAAMNDVSPSETGLASGVLNTAFMMGGSLALAVLASLAAAHTNALSGQGAPELEALAQGYRLAFFAGAGCVALAAALGLLLRGELKAEGASALAH